MTAPSSGPPNHDDPARDPIRASQQAMRPSLPRRFYRSAGAIERDGRFEISLDGRTARTPARHLLALPTRAAADAVVAEWERQGTTIDPAAMPMTRLANSAIDTVARDPAAVRAEIVKYAGTDLLCYRAGEPEKLVARQSARWDPVLAWADEALGARFFLSQGIRHVEQPPATLRAIDDAVGTLEVPFGLAALNLMTVLSGSAVLALAVARAHLPADDAWGAAHVDEDFQIETWGEDLSAAARRQARWRDFQAAARLMATLVRG